MSPKEPLVTCVSISLSILLFFFEPGQGGGDGDSLCIKWLSVGWWWLSVCLVKARAGSPCRCSLSLREQICRSFFPLIQKGWVSCKWFTYKPATPTITFLAQSEVLCECSETGNCCHLTGLWFAGGKKEPRALSLLSQCKKQKKCKEIKKKKKNPPKWASRSFGGEMGDTSTSSSFWEAAEPLDFTDEQETTRKNNSALLLRREEGENIGWACKKNIPSSLGLSALLPGHLSLFPVLAGWGQGGWAWPLAPALPSTWLDFYVFMKHIKVFPNSWKLLLDWSTATALTHSFASGDFHNRSLLLRLKLQEGYLRGGCSTATSAREERGALAKGKRGN